jgi:hypothetical protein
MMTGRGLINEDTWRREECSWEIEFPKPETIPRRRMLHRLPVLLVVLPSMSGLVSCLCATVHHWDDFRIKQSLKNRCYREYTNAITPSFVRTVGERIENDAVFFVDDDKEYENLTYVCVDDDFIDLIGWLVDQEVENFESDLSTAEYVHDLPHWLQDYPVQRLLRFTADLDEASGFTLAPRVFPEEFRPAFPSEAPLTAPVRQNTIAAYLLQNLVDAKGSAIFHALKSDAIEKAAAAKDLIEIETLKFQGAFEERYGK